MDIKKIRQQYARFYIFYITVLFIASIIMFDELKYLISKNYWIAVFIFFVPFLLVSSYFGIRHQYLPVRLSIKGRWARLVGFIELAICIVLTIIVITSTV